MISLSLTSDTHHAGQSLPLIDVSAQESTPAPSGDDFATILTAADTFAAQTQIATPYLPQLGAAFAAQDSGQIATQSMPDQKSPDLAMPIDPSSQLPSASDQPSLQTPLSGAHHGTATAPAPLDLEEVVASSVSVAGPVPEAAEVACPAEQEDDENSSQTVASDTEAKSVNDMPDLTTPTLLAQWAVITRQQVPQVPPATAEEASDTAGVQAEQPGTLGNGPATELVSAAPHKQPGLPSPSTASLPDTLLPVAPEKKTPAAQPTAPEITPVSSSQPTAQRPRAPTIALVPTPSIQDRQLAEQTFDTTPMRAAGQNVGPDIDLSSPLAPRASAEIEPAGGTAEPRQNSVVGTAQQTASLDPAQPAAPEIDPKRRAEPIQAIVDSKLALSPSKSMPPTGDDPEIAVVRTAVAGRAGVPDSTRSHTKGLPLAPNQTVQGSMAGTTPQADHSTAIPNKNSVTISASLTGHLQRSLQPVPIALNPGSQADVPLNISPNPSGTLAPSQQQVQGTGSPSQGGVSVLAEESAPIDSRYAMGPTSKPADRLEPVPVSTVAKSVASTPAPTRAAPNPMTLSQTAPEPIGISESFTKPPVSGPIPAAIAPKVAFGTAPQTASTPAIQRHSAPSAVPTPASTVFPAIRPVAPLSPQAAVPTASLATYPSAIDSQDASDQPFPLEPKSRGTAPNLTQSPSHPSSATIPAAQLGPRPGLFTATDPGQGKANLDQLVAPQAVAPRVAVASAAPATRIRVDPPRVYPLSISPKAIDQTRPRSPDLAANPATLTPTIPLPSSVIPTTLDPVSDAQQPRIPNVNTPTQPTISTTDEVGQSNRTQARAPNETARPTLQAALPEKSMDPLLSPRTGNGPTVSPKADQPRVVPIDPPPAFSRIVLPTAERAAQLQDPGPLPESNAKFLAMTGMLGSVDVGQRRLQSTPRQSVPLGTFRPRDPHARDAAKLDTDIQADLQSALKPNQSHVSRPIPTGAPSISMADHSADTAQRPTQVDLPRSTASSVDDSASAVQQSNLSADNALPLEKQPSRQTFAGQVAPSQGEPTPGDQPFLPFPIASLAEAASPQLPARYEQVKTVDSAPAPRKATQTRRTDNEPIAIPTPLPYASRLASDTAQLRPQDLGQQQLGGDMAQGQLHKPAALLPTDQSVPFQPPVTPSAAPTFIANAAGPFQDAKRLPHALTSSLTRTALRAGKEDKVELILDPAELGKVRFDFITTGDRMQVNLSVERGETLDLLRRHAEQLRAEFRDAGFDGSSLSFSQWTQQGSDNSRPESLNDDPELGQFALSVSEPTPSRTRNTTGQGLDLRL